MFFGLLLATFVFFGGGGISAAAAATVAFNAGQLTTLKKILSLGAIDNFVKIEAEACATEFTGIEFVVCDADGYVTHLNLAGTGMTGFLSYHFGMLTRLVYLNVSRNNLTGPVNTLLKNLKKMRHFDISSNYMNGDVVDIIQNMPQLEQCVLVARGQTRHTNCFEGVLPQAFPACNLDKVDSLQLCATFLPRSRPLPTLKPEPAAPTTEETTTTTTAESTTTTTTTAAAAATVLEKAAPTIDIFIATTNAVEDADADASRPLEFVERTLRHATPEGTFVMVDGVLRSDSDSPADADVNTVMMIIFSLLAGLVCMVGLCLGAFVYNKRRRERDCEMPFHNSMRGEVNEPVFIPSGLLPPPPLNPSDLSISSLPQPYTPASSTSKFVEVPLQAASDDNDAPNAGNSNGVYAQIGSLKRPGDGEYSSLPITSTMRRRPIHNNVVYDRVVKNNSTLTGAQSQYGLAPPPALYQTNSSTHSSPSSTISSTSSTKDYGALMNNFMARPSDDNNDEEDSF